MWQSVKVVISYLLVFVVMLLDHGFFLELCLFKILTPVGLGHRAHLLYNNSSTLFFFLNTKKTCLITPSACTSLLFSFLHVGEQRAECSVCNINPPPPLPFLPNLKVIHKCYFLLTLPTGVEEAAITISFLPFF